MIHLEGKFNRAKVFTNNVDETAKAQITELCNQEFTKGNKIRVMPDVHAGAGCTIGTTMTISDKIIPNLVGVDIGCGMAVTRLSVTKDEINFDELDSVVRKFVPSGFEIRDKPHSFAGVFNNHKVRAPLKEVQRIKNSLGTLGGGNHFVELNEGEDGSIYLVIHSGSRNLGTQIAKHYQKLAYKELTNMKSEKDYIIEKLKSEGREKEIHQALRGVKSPKIRKDLAYLEGQAFTDYMHDMEIAQNYAWWNRLAMSYEIITNMGWKWNHRFDTIHNYIDMKHMIMRKGAISAQPNEKVVIPINMRDGSIIARGKGNPDWNYSAPHGAGRMMSRSKARESVHLDDFKESMTGVWSTSVLESTIDEAPMAYKSMDDIVDNVGDAIEILEVIKPLYNFKAN